VAGFSAEQLKAALEYCRDWNTNSRTCHVAQAMLQAILVRHPPRVRDPGLSTCPAAWEHNRPSAAAVLNHVGRACYRGEIDAVWHVPASLC